MYTASLSRTRPRVLPELLLVTALYFLYRLGRLLANGNVTEAFANADRVWRWERAVHLPDEASVQSLLLHGELPQKAANVFYSSVHFPAMIVFLLWMFYRHPAHYVWVRRTLTLLTGAALVLHLAFPLAPPRMIPAFGLVDTGHVVGPSPYGKVDTEGMANQFAAMPSLHVGWALVIAIGLIAAGRSRWRWLWLAHPALTLFVVVATANHYWLDAIVASLLLAGALLIVRRPEAVETVTPFRRRVRAPRPEPDDA
ncbi:phosphatase PAP2 family protein [Actinomadura sp. DC4]|uniref:phosphatase PAP2 family protein n=1 Tax=Actinomadura sp. DC4 TaxID=3055069 RepID=UPI0025AF2C88|nr:phosphatase PAP2 family protein [Actinomadura sp. DC4]MDN3354366.1 phosphatase PAP2 family protein [Actinomadura sp. DC4]